MDKDLIWFKKIIKSNGYKFTIQKQHILETFIKSNIHLNVEEIYKDVKNYSVGLATVYRSLKVFSELNIIKELGIDGVNYYEMKIFSKKPSHIHFKCNSIVDIDSKFLDLDYLGSNSEIERENNLIVFDANIMLIGLCSKCREDKHAKTN